MLRNLQFAIATCLFAIANNVLADAIVISGVSWHATSHGGDTAFNEINPGMGYEHVLNETHTLSLGFYDNSSNRITEYALDIWQPFQWTPDFGKLKVGLAMGLATGYGDGYVMPMAVPMVTYENHTWGLNLITLTFPDQLLIKRSVFAAQLKVILP